MKDQKVQADALGVIAAVLGAMREFGSIRRSYRYIRDADGKRLSEHSYEIEEYLGDLPDPTEYIFRKGVLSWIYFLLSPPCEGGVAEQKRGRGGYEWRNHPFRSPPS